MAPSDRFDTLIGLLGSSAEQGTPWPRPGTWRRRAGEGAEAAAEWPRFRVLGPVEAAARQTAWQTWSGQGETEGHRQAIVVSSSYSCWRCTDRERLCAPVAAAEKNNGRRRNCQQLTTRSSEATPLRGQMPDQRSLNSANVAM